MPTRPTSLKILCITSVFSPSVGGAASVVEGLAGSFPREIAVLTPAADPSLLGSSSEEDFDGRLPYQVFRTRPFSAVLPRSIPGKLRGPLQFAWNLLWVRPQVRRDLLQAVDASAAQVICIGTLWSAFWIPEFLLRRRPDLKVVFYLHGEEVNDSPVKTRLDRMAQAQLRKADAAVTVSAYTRTRTLGCGVSAEKITVIHNGVDVRRFTPGEPSAALRARFGLAGRKVLLCLARLDERKGQDKLIEAMPEILKAVPEALLLLVGSGEDEARLRALHASLGSSPAVIFAGRAADDEVAAYYRTADVYVMPNRTTEGGDTEGFGLVYLEAGACAKPVLGGLAGGVPDAVIDGKTGLLVDGTSVPAITEACIRLLSNSSLAATLAANGLAHSRANSWDAQGRRFLDLCRKLLDATPSRAQ